MSPARQSDERRERFESVALPLLDELYRAALTMTRSPVGAQQLVQETFARAYAAYELTGMDGQPRSWLFRTLTDTFAHWYRQQPDSDVTRAMDALPDELRIAVHLADVEQFSYAEIADITSTSVDTVAGRLREGRRQLGARLTTPAAAN